MEIEIRAKINNLENIEQNIIKLGAKLIKQKNQVDEYFGEINLYKKLGYSFLMRVRDEGTKKFLTYKGAELKKDGIWQEYELEIDDIKKSIAMLQAMGLEKIIAVKKYRKEYTLNGLTICLDVIDDLGNFIEIESVDDKDINKDSLKNLMQKLNIKEKQIIHKGYVTILLIKNNSPYSKYIVN
jgi:adenylate cyclase class 2